MDLYRRLLAEREIISALGEEAPSPSEGELLALRHYAQHLSLSRLEAADRVRLRARFPFEYARLLGKQEDRGGTL